MTCTCIYICAIHAQTPDIITHNINWTHYISCKNAIGLPLMKSDNKLPLPSQARVTPTSRREDMHFVWFSMWDGFFSARVSESRLSRVATRVGFEDEWWEIHLAWKTIQNAFSRILYTLIKLDIMCKVADHENHVRWIYLTTVLCKGEMSEVCENNQEWHPRSL